MSSVLLLTKLTMHLFLYLFSFSSCNPWRLYSISTFGRAKIQSACEICICTVECEFFYMSNAMIDSHFVHHYHYIKYMWWRYGVPCVASRMDARNVYELYMHIAHAHCHHDNHLVNKWMLCDFINMRLFTLSVSKGQHRSDEWRSISSLGSAHATLRHIRHRQSDILLNGNHFDASHWQ